MADSMPTSTEFSLCDPVRFPHLGKMIQGHIARKTARRALVVTADGSEYKVPWQLLARHETGQKKSVNLRNDALKARFRPDDEVSFPYESGTLRGVIARLGPERAVVACDDRKDYRVPYALLEPIAPDSGRADDQQLAEVSRLADRLIHRHGLGGWSFQFNDASRQAGRCDYGTRVISLSRLFCLKAPVDEVRETILHEIAHALVGPEHNHDSIWKTTARSIGCSGNRCHEVDFAPSRYIVSCHRCGWSRQANRRRPGSVCRTCSNPVTFQTYTSKAWERMRSRKGRSAPGG
jgi:predicted SprT family Zn-dependent metalloprotease